MNFEFDTHIFILICCLLQGLVGLRLIKVSIPAYKLRGESAFLECQYELNKSRRTTGSILTRNKNNYNKHQYQRVEGSTNMHYIDNSDSRESVDVPTHRHTRTRQQQKFYLREAYFQPLQQAYLGQLQGGSGSSSSSIGNASGSITSGGETYYQQQYNYQPQKQHQFYYTQKYKHPEYQHTPPPSPYGYSIYRGRTQISSSLSSLPSFSLYKNKNAGHIDASTHIGKTYLSSNGAIRAASSFAQHPAHNDDTHPKEHGDDVEDNTSSESEEYDDDDEEKVGNFYRHHEEVAGEDLYAIKWYKDNEEFYRYVPKANPQKASYRVDGVRVVEEHSDSTRVMLRGLTINSTGLYRCEISAEAPNFSSVQGEGRMDIVYLPRDGPHIRGQQKLYQIGETLHLNCTSGKSHPASHLQWFVNGQTVVDEQFLLHYNNTVHRHGLITSALGLVMVVEAHDFSSGPMHVKCLASISPVLWKGDKENVVQRRPGIIDNREAMFFVYSSSRSLHHHRNYNNIVNSLAQLRFLTITTILIKLCQLLLLHTEFSKITDVYKKQMHTSCIHKEIAN